MLRKMAIIASGLAVISCAVQAEDFSLTRLVPEFIKIMPPNHKLAGSSGEEEDDILIYYPAKEYNSTLTTVVKIGNNPPHVFVFDCEGGYLVDFKNGYRIAKGTVAHAIEREICGNK